MKAKLQRFFEIFGFEGKGKVLLVRKIILTPLLLHKLPYYVIFSTNYILERLT